MNTMTASEQSHNQPPSLERRLSIDSCDLYADVEHSRHRRVKRDSSSRRSARALYPQDTIEDERLAPSNGFDFLRNNSGTTSAHKPSKYEYEYDYEYEVASEAASGTNQMRAHPENENPSASNASKTPLSGSNYSSQREGTGRKTSPADKSLSRSTTWSKSPKASKSGERSKSGDHSETIEKNLVTNVRSALERTERGSNFFTATQASRLPRFDVEDINIGSFLGQGQFGDVFDISSFQKEWGHCDCLRCQRALRKKGNPTQQDEDAEGGKPPLKRTGSIVNFAKLAQTTDNMDTIIYVPTRAAGTKDVDETDALSSGMQLDKAYMKAHCVRAGAPRFALKRVRSDNEGANPLWMLGATIDLAIEAKFLASLNHPNIIKMRGTLGEPGHNDFAIVLDRMTTTLDKAIDQWKRELKSRKYMLNIARKLRDGRALELKRLLVMYDISSALQYLHRNKIIYRDLKPDNIGVDIRGTVKLFDFGLCRELQDADGFEMTGLTGTRRYMAPEVILCQDYDLKADVYSFGILFWEVAALAQPFRTYNVDQHFRKVVVKGKRPAIYPAAWLPPNMRLLMYSCWTKESIKRPTFRQITARLQGEILTRESETRIFGRRMDLVDDKSWVSRHGYMETPDCGSVKGD